jgi:hypothetical protein
MSNSTTCPFCDESISWVGYGKHILSHKHSEQLLGCRISGAEWKERMLADAECKKMAGLYLKTIASGKSYCCFACKKVRRSEDVDHFVKSPGCLDKHKKLLKEFLDKAPVSVPPEVKALNDKIAAQQLQIKKANRARDDAQEQTENLREAICGFLGIQIDDPDTLIEFLQSRSLQEISPEACGALRMAQSEQSE